MNEAYAPTGRETQPSLKVLVIDDEESIVDLIKLGLKYEGFQVEAAFDGPEGLAAAQRIDPDLIILDSILPGVDGLEVLRQLRLNPITRDVPVLMLTAKGKVQDKVTGLETGADDYLAKPFALEELRARLRALLRRSGASAELLRFADVELDLAAYQARRGGRRLPVTKTELALLELFLRNPGRVLSRTQIFESVWGYDFGPESNGLWVYMSYLRRKMGEPRLIQTVRGLGYVLREEP